MSRKACCLCEEAEVSLESLAQHVDFDLEIIDVDVELALATRYGADVPVLLIDGELLMQHKIDLVSLEKQLNQRRTQRC
ncbi:MAG: glutaredoxin family protein [Mariprofundaceae bacterium]